MRRLFALLLLIASPAFAQVQKQQDDSLQEQLLPESFKIAGSATAIGHVTGYWETTLIYSVTNNSGMNLYLGVAQNGLALGSCGGIGGMVGGLPMLPLPNAGGYSPNGGEPRGIYVPSGVKVSGTVILAMCSAPNPGSPTAPLSLTMMIGRKPAFDTMFIFPASADVPIQQIQYK